MVDQLSKNLTQRAVLLNKNHFEQQDEPESVVSQVFHADFDQSNLVEASLPVSIPTSQLPQITQPSQLPQITQIA